MSDHIKSISSQNFLVVSISFLLIFTLPLLMGFIVIGGKSGTDSVNDSTLKSTSIKFYRSEGGTLYELMSYEPTRESYSDSGSGQIFPIILYKANNEADSIKVEQITIERAEGGTVIEFYAKHDDRDPIMTVPILLDVHHAVHVSICGSTASSDPNVKVERTSSYSGDCKFALIQLSRPFPELLILGTR
jgi:hypothetical protein